jgi:hypothetical protein
MDPYLEDSEIFPDFHDAFITYVRETLQAALPRPYLAGIGRRAWIEFAERLIGPDVEILLTAAGRRRPSGAVAVAETPRNAPISVFVPHDEVIEPLIEIYSRKGSKRRLITAVEVLSPSNKLRGSLGRNIYIEKQQEIVKHSEVNLVEIDLLRGGEHTTAVPLGSLHAAIGSCDYHVCIHKFNDPQRYFLHGIGLEELLPEIEIPLLPGDGVVRLDLQTVFNRTYDVGPYQYEIDYQQKPPGPSLSKERLPWLASVTAKHTA